MKQQVEKKPRFVTDNPLEQRTNKSKDFFTMFDGECNHCADDSIKKRLNTGAKHWTKGMPSRPYMFDTAQMMRKQVPQMAKELLK